MHGLLACRWHVCCAFGKSAYGSYQKLKPLMESASSDLVELKSLCVRFLHRVQFRTVFRTTCMFRTVIGLLTSATLVIALSYSSQCQDLQRQGTDVSLGQSVPDLRSSPGALQKPRAGPSRLHQARKNPSLREPKRHPLPARRGRSRSVRNVRTCLAVRRWRH